ncbi:hypothetical protein HD806DRAFT_540345 [Xylariaceae sp. AK1471]|nr:hypothetical protein HD806DRAFT_540345 [Xylariaceae sp. AK1471]
MLKKHATPSLDDVAWFQNERTILQTLIEYTQIRDQLAANYEQRYWDLVDQFKTTPTLSMGTETAGTETSTIVHDGVFLKNIEAAFVYVMAFTAAAYVHRKEMLQPINE